MTIDFETAALDMRTRDLEHALGRLIDNWLAWGRGRDWKPAGYKCPLGVMYQSARVSSPLLYIEATALQFEAAVVALPEKQRQAFILHHMERAPVSGQMRRIKEGRAGKARALGVQVRQFSYLVNAAHRALFAAFRPDRRDTGANG